MPLAEALAIERRLRVFEEDPGEDRRALGRLAEWAECFSPAVGLEDGPCPQCLLLDLTGCAGCFGSEGALLRRAVADLRASGWVARVTIADTVGAAWGVAHYGRTPGLVPPGQTKESLLLLPTAALRLPFDALDLLARLGVERVAQLMDLSRDSLPHRVGPAVLQRLDQALGHLPEVIVPHRPPQAIAARFEFEYATDRLEVVGQAIDFLAEQLHEMLHRRHQGAQQVECLLHHEATPPTRVEASLSRPSRSARHLGVLLHTRLERVRIAGPVSALSLHVTAAEPLQDAQSELLETGRPPGDKGFAAFIDCLSNHLGCEAVTRAQLVSDPQPEYACRFEPFIQGTPKPRGQRPRKNEPSASQEQDRIVLSRPLCLWPTPKPVSVLSVIPDGPPTRIAWAGSEYRVVRTWGPERIEAGWWRGDDVHRDYYITATDRGSRFWVFRRRDDGRWFLHGSFE